jgi:hypothetical protein
MQFQNKKFSSQQDFGKKWRTFSKTGFRGQEPRGFRASLLTGLYYRLRYCNFLESYGHGFVVDIVDRPLLPLAVLQRYPLPSIHTHS